MLYISSTEKNKVAVKKMAINNGDYICHRPVRDGISRVKEACPKCRA